MTKNMVVQGGCVGDDGDSAVGNRGGSSTMASYIPKKIDGQFLVKGNCCCHLQASCCQNRLHAWRHQN